MNQNVGEEKENASSSKPLTRRTRRGKARRPPLVPLGQNASIETRGNTSKQGKVADRPVRKRRAKARSKRTVEDVVVQSDENDEEKKNSANDASEQQTENNNKREVSNADVPNEDGSSLERHGGLSSVSQPGNLESSKENTDRGNSSTPDRSPRSPPSNHDDKMVVETPPEHEHSAVEMDSQEADDNDSNPKVSLPSKQVPKEIISIVDEDDCELPPTDEKIAEAAQQAEKEVEPIHSVQPNLVLSVGHDTEVSKSGSKRDSGRFSIAKSDKVVQLAKNDGCDDEAVDQDDLRRSNIDESNVVEECLQEDSDRPDQPSKDLLGNSNLAYEEHDESENVMKSNVPETEESEEDSPVIKRFRKRTRTKKRMKTIAAEKKTNTEIIVISDDDAPEPGPTSQQQETENSLSEEMEQKRQGSKDNRASDGSTETLKQNKQPQVAHSISLQNAHEKLEGDLTLRSNDVHDSPGIDSPEHGIPSGHKRSNSRPNDPEELDSGDQEIPEMSDYLKREGSHSRTQKEFGIDLATNSEKSGEQIVHKASEQRMSEEFGTQREAENSEEIPNHLERKAPAIVNIDEEKPQTSDTQSASTSRAPEVTERIKPTRRRPPKSRTQSQQKDPSHGVSQGASSLVKAKSDYTPSTRLRHGSHMSMTAAVQMALQTPRSQIRPTNTAQTSQTTNRRGQGMVVGRNGQIGDSDISVLSDLAATPSLAHTPGNNTRRHEDARHRRLFNPNSLYSASKNSMPLSSQRPPAALGQMLRTPVPRLDSVATASHKTSRPNGEGKMVMSSLRQRMERLRAKASGSSASISSACDPEQRHAEDGRPKKIDALLPPKEPKVSNAISSSEPLVRFATSPKREVSASTAGQSNFIQSATADPPNEENVLKDLGLMAHTAKPLQKNNSLASSSTSHGEDPVPATHLVAQERLDMKTSGSSSQLSQPGLAHPIQSGLIAHGKQLPSNSNATEEVTLRSSHCSPHDVETSETQAQQETRGAVASVGSNLVSSVAAFMPFASSFFGVQNEKREDSLSPESKAVLLAKKQREDAERREAEVAARREAERIAKQREAKAKQKNAEHRRKMLAQAEKLREQERQRKEQIRKRKRKEEEEKNRLRKEEEDRKKEERRQRVLEKKKLMMEEQKRALQERGNALKMRNAAGPSSSRPGRPHLMKAGKAIASHGLPPPVPKTPATKRRDPDEEPQYEMTGERKRGSTDDYALERERRKKKKTPKWASSSQVWQSVREESTDPDSVFARGVPSCNLETVFEGREQKRRYRARDESGDWTKDRLTAKEEMEYKRQAGFFGGS